MRKGTYLLCTGMPVFRELGTRFLQMPLRRSSESIFP